ncbi:hypothetical protein BGX27_008783 [Mortierella sp. AM989]|nr:hypothetical protein BGX27_008783 [Mortierella sp. AM989]
MSFSAARSAVNSAISAYTEFLPMKEQLGSLPVVGRLLKHPVMDSALSYIATKASERGICLGGLDTKNLITPEDIPYRKLNEMLVQQAMALSVLSVQKEELSKAIGDEAGDDAFELYLAAVNTLLHALPYETCDPLRREAFVMQLRNFMEEQFDQNVDGHLNDTESCVKLRRRRRRRHHHHYEQATTLIHQHTSTADEQVHSQQRDQQMQERKKRREQHVKEQQALKKQQNLLQQQLEKDMKNQNQSKQQPPFPLSSAPRGSSNPRSQQENSCAHASVGDNNNNNNAGGLSDTITSTAVHLAICLKQSPIPDVVKSCFHTSKTIFHKVDERFHLQDMAWKISKNSIERAIELDEKYAIHEVVTDIMFATFTGLVKAGIAYKETPSYVSIKAAAATGGLEGGSATPPTSATAAISSGSSHNSQEVNKLKKKGTIKSSKDLKQMDKDNTNTNADTNTGKPGIMSSWGGRGRKAAIVESEPKYDSEVDSDESEYDSDRSYGSTTMLSSSSFTGPVSGADQGSEKSEMMDDDDEKVIELNQQTLRPNTDGSKIAATAAAATVAIAALKDREKISMFSALRGAASLVYYTS